MGQPILKQTWSDQSSTFYQVSVPLVPNRGSGMSFNTGGSQTYQEYEFIIRKDLATGFLTDETGNVSAPPGGPQRVSPHPPVGPREQLAKTIADAYIQSFVWAGAWTPSSGRPQLMETRKGTDSATGLPAEFVVYEVALVMPMGSGMAWPPPVSVIIKDVSGVLTVIAGTDPDFQNATVVP